MVFQKRMRRSAVPPPDASKPLYNMDHRHARMNELHSSKRSGPTSCGDQAMALTAAVCSENLCRGVSLDPSHTNNLLSFPPDASHLPSRFHFNPHTYTGTHTHTQDIGTMNHGLFFHIVLTTRRLDVRRDAPLAGAP